MANIRRFHPGIYIKETLEAMEMTAREFSARTGIYERTLSTIINGNEDITFDIAYKLSLYFDNSVNYWTNLQNQYNLYTYEIESEKRDSSRSADRKDQVGSGDRSEKIRTYNYPQMRITDHRVDFTSYKFSQIVEEGDLDEMIDVLTSDYEARRILENQD